MEVPSAGFIRYGFVSLILSLTTVAGCGVDHSQSLDAEAVATSSNSEALFFNRCNRYHSRATVLEALDALETEDAAALTSLLAEDVVYQNTGLPTIRGRDAMLGFLGQIFLALNSTSVDIRNMMVRRGEVMTRRVDFVEVATPPSEPAKTLNLPIMGYFRLNNDCQIELWSDHFDTLTWETGTGILVPHEFPPDLEE